MTGRRLVPAVFSAALVGSVVVTTALSAAPKHSADGINKIKHFVFIMQENRSFDSYFGTYPGADGIPKDVVLKGPPGKPPVAPYHDTHNVNRGGPHNWGNAHRDINGGKMDGFLIESYSAVNVAGKS